MAHSEIDEILGRRTVVYLAENLGQITWTVIHSTCDQVQIDILGVILHHEIFEECCDLSGRHGSSAWCEYGFVIVLLDLKLLFDLQENILKLL